MNRKEFVFKLGGMVFSVWMAPAFAGTSPQNDSDRIALGTLLFRYRFQRTKPKELSNIKNELTLAEVPRYYKQRFGIRKIEFWNEHFESLEPDYLAHIKEQIKAAGSELLDVQVDRISYNLAATDDGVRQKSIADVKEWIDAAAFLGSTCVRINPGAPNGSVEKSIDSLKALKAYAGAKKLTVITANHFGLEMDADKHVQIVKGSGVYTEPDFGNYIPQYTTAEMMASLKKILPYAYIVSAKMVDFDQDMNHMSYGFDQCIELAERMGFKGTYMVAQWSSKFQDIDYEKVADWGIEHIRKHLRP